jgi:ABC-2 type transport system ATP-binding protein
MRQKNRHSNSCNKAKALLLDEPTSGLDPKHQTDFQELYKNQPPTDHRILMATHDIFLELKE